MKHTFIIFLFSLLLTGCSRPDTDLARQITGTWNHEAHRGFETHYVTAVYAPGGGFSITTKGEDFTSDMAGTWRVEGKVILLTVTNASRGNYSYIGQVLKCRVDHVDSHQLDYQDIIERIVKGSGRAVMQIRIDHVKRAASRLPPPSTTATVRASGYHRKVG
jgi:hypothetical protein